MQDEATLLRLIAETKSALLAGHLQEVASLAEATESALTTFEAGIRMGKVPPDAAALVEIREAASACAELLAAARNGVEDVRKRLTEKADFNTYDKSGRRALVRRGDPATPRRL